MILIYLTIPGSSFIGHFCGLIAGLLIKFGGLYLVFPRYDWIAAFDDIYSYKLGGVNYLRATSDIESDFNSLMWDYLL